MKKENMPWYPPSRATLDVLADIEEAKGRKAIVAGGCTQMPEKFTQAELDGMARQMSVEATGSRIMLGSLLLVLGLEAFAAVVVLVWWMTTT